MRKTPRIFVFVALMLPLVTSAQAGTTCQFGGANELICSKAVLIAHQINEKAPRKVAQKVVLKSADAKQATVRVNGEMGYSKDKLEKSLSNGLQKQDVVKRMTNMMCGSNTTKRFLTGGGSFRYVFKLTDGSTVLDHTISHCAESKSQAD